MLTHAKKKSVVATKGSYTRTQPSSKTVDCKEVDLSVIFAIGLSVAFSIKISATSYAMAVCL
jgi:hypothetical protein